MPKNNCNPFVRDPNLTVFVTIYIGILSCIIEKKGFCFNIKLHFLFSIVSAPFPYSEVIKLSTRNKIKYLLLSYAGSLKIASKPYAESMEIRTGWIPKDLNGKYSRLAGLCLPVISYRQSLKLNSGYHGGAVVKFLICSIRDVLYLFCFLKN